MLKTGRLRLPRAQSAGGQNPEKWGVASTANVAPFNTGRTEAKRMLKHPNKISHQWERCESRNPRHALQSLESVSSGVYSDKSFSH